jgi:hypothetical protein
MIICRKNGQNARSETAHLPVLEKQGPENGWPVFKTGSRSFVGPHLWPEENDPAHFRPLSLETGMSCFLGRFWQGHRSLCGPFLMSLRNSRRNGLLPVSWAGSRLLLFSPFTRCKCIMLIEWLPAHYFKQSGKEGPLLNLASACPYRHFLSLGNAQLRAHGSTWYLFLFSDTNSYTEHVLSRCLAIICTDSQRVCPVFKTHARRWGRFYGRDVLARRLHSMNASIAHRVFQARLWTPTQLSERLSNRWSTTAITGTRFRPQSC